MYSSIKKSHSLISGVQNCKNLNFSKISHLEYTEIKKKTIHVPTVVMFRTLSLYTVTTCLKMESGLSF